MAVLKCKMCGGDLNLTEGASTAECEYCGSVQTIPKVDDEKKLTLFTRANRLRAACEFDKAAGIYEAIVADFPEEAEAYWGLVLCTYGIEYVDDPATGKKVPTCHRSGFDSVMKDANVELAQEYADVMARKLYREEAKAIEELRKGIIAVSANEQPYDLFICYKETDFNGKRTLDSVLAQDIYDALTDKGYRVFFSRISLEDKLGVEYEPYIFAALNSAKIMLVVGTDYEYFNAVWVKNEWSRFLRLMAQDKSKHLIPCFKGVDAYDMPEEFARLQAQDLDKMGAVQDIVRGVQKLLPKQEQIVKETVVVQQPAGNNPTIESYLKRVFMFLQDGDWKSADEYCEKVLDINPECAEAYLGKLMVELRVKRQAGLANYAEPFDRNKNYEKAVRFAKTKLASELRGYIAAIKDRNARKAEEARRETLYLKAMDDYKSHNIVRLQEAIKVFTSLAGYKDSNERIRLCQAKIDQIRIKEENERIERERLAEEKRIADEKARLEKQRQAEIDRVEAEKRAKRNKKIAMIATPIVVAVIVFIIVLNAVIIPNGKYNDAIALMNDGKYEDAISVFESLDGYKDSITQIENCKTALLDVQYEKAIGLLETGKYDAAYAILQSLGEYESASDKIKESKYSRATDLFNAKEYDAALVLLNQLPNNYKNVTQMIGKSYINKKIKVLSTASVGDIVDFGKYKQGSSNEVSEIEWYVIDKQGDSVLLVSRYILDEKPFYESEPTTPGWENSYIRNWLNTEFLNDAFNNYEQQCIINSKLKNPNNSYGYGGSNDTFDKVFLLSVVETEKYLNPLNITKTEGAPYVNTIIYYLRTVGNCDESTYHTKGYVAVVGAYGVDEEGLNGYKSSSYYDARHGVRPAIWVDISEIE